MSRAILKLDQGKYSAGYFRREMRRVNRLSQHNHDSIKKRAELMSALVRVLPLLSDEHLHQITEAAKSLAALHPPKQLEESDVPF